MSKKATKHCQFVWKGLRGQLERAPMDPRWDHLSIKKKKKKGIFNGVKYTKQAKIQQFTLILEKKSLVTFKGC